MSVDRKEPDAPSPDRFMERDVSDLRVSVGKFEERIDGIKETMVTKEDLANANVEVWKGRAEAWKFALTLIIPLLAAAIGAFVAVFSGLVKVVLGP